MSILQRYYNRTFGDYGVMQCCRSFTDNETKFIPPNERTKEDWDDLHRVWTIEPLLEDS